MVPVVNDKREVIGMITDRDIISLNDVVAAAECRKGAEVPGEEFLDTLKTICARSTAPVSV